MLRETSGDEGDPIRVLFVFAWLVVGGEETEVRLLAQNLDPARYRLEVLSTYRRPNMPDQTHQQLEALGVCVDTRCYELPPEEHPVHLMRRIRDGQFEVVVACQGVRPICLAYDLLRYGAQHGRPQPPPLVEHGGLVCEVFQTPKQHTTAYVGVCREIRDAAASVLKDPDRALEIPSIVDLSEFQPEHRPSARAELGIAPDEPLVGWVGRLDPKKRVEDFLEACGHVAAVRPPLRSETADFVMDVTPPHAHAQVAEQAFTAGLHLIGEKPLSDNWDTARRVVELGRRSGVKHMITQNYRFHPEPRTTRRLLEEGRIGPPPASATSASTWTGRTSPAPTTSPSPSCS